MPARNEPLHVLVRLDPYEDEFARLFGPAADGEPHGERRPTRARESAYDSFSYGQVNQSSVMDSYINPFVSYPDGLSSGI